MDFSSPYCQLILLVILANTLVYLHFSVRKSKRSKSTKHAISKQLPQPRGALPFIGHLHLLGGKKTIARTLGTMADECGPIYSLRVGQQQAIVLSSWEMVKEWILNADAATATRPPMAVSKHFAYDYASFAISPYGKYWRDIRKIATVELLSIRRLDKMKHIIASEVSSCIRHLFQECRIVDNKFQTGKISLCKWLECTSFNIAIRVIVGKTFSPESYEDSATFASQFKKLIGKATYVAGVAVPSDFIPSIEWMDVMGYIRSMKDIHREIDTIIGHWLDEHIRRRKEGQGTWEDTDFMDVMLSNIAEGAAMSGYTRETVIKATALILLLTGSESTSVTVTWVISLLMNHPKALKTVQEELDRQVGKQRWVEESDIKNLPYLQAIVKETLRLYPPSPLAGPREAMEDCHIDGHFIPKGTRIIVDIWKVHRDPRVWAQPDEFRPERFLDEHGGIDFRGQNFEYIPFSLGRRACPGMNFGLHVVHLELARLVQGFDIWTEDGGSVDMSEGLGLALPKATPLNVILAARLPIELYDALDFLKSQIDKPLLLAGSAVPLPPSGELEDKWEQWLAKFPEKSVIFCNFGSETYLNEAQIKELTLGLELTNLPFFLVLNFGTSGADAQNKLEASLPEGFKERVKHRGVVHTGWVQQQHILAHTSVGCYLNHSGFSSVIEGIVNDCQLAFVPQKGDQFMNSKLLSGDLRIGVEVNRRDDDGFFGKEDILEAINTIMVDIDKEPGRSIRENHQSWKEFFLNKEIEDRYVANLVKELQDLAGKV